jgi:hypothetical protein
LIEPVLSAWRFERRGRALDFWWPPEHDLREIMNAILYVDRTGVQWRYLPHDFPPWETVYGYFAKWAKEGVFLDAAVLDLGQDLEPAESSRLAEPCLATLRTVTLWPRVVLRSAPISVLTSGASSGVYVRLVTEFALAVIPGADVSRQQSP